MGPRGMAGLVGKRIRALQSSHTHAAERSRAGDGPRLPPVSEPGTRSKAMEEKRRLGAWATRQTGTRVPGVIRPGLQSQWQRPLQPQPQCYLVTSCAPSDSLRSLRADLQHDTPEAGAGAGEREPPAWPARAELADLLAIIDERLRQHRPAQPTAEPPRPGCCNNSHPTVHAST
ncbi:hypothetical protein CDD81_6521 [Ophiocordyceps australis]|uniref:Uncharacterized protein n=1 Tax=Ophiocordyceps australis TaxID=1399860 RepID=A0A2C5YI74_9HYPO|nr:hypothetical protein CDD81_6521 [Ophiocordyceps australis]